MKKGKIIVTITIGLVCFLLMMVIFMQFKIVYEKEQTNIDTLTEAQLREEIASWKKKYEEIKQKYDEIQSSIDSYKQESDSDNKTKDTLEKELKNLEMELGLTNVEGEGITITLVEGTDVNPINSEDLLYIVNVLKDAGAEAISINDERVVHTTDIVNITENLLKMNSRFIRENTYIIKAIGNSSYLESSILGKGGYGTTLLSAGINVNVQKSNKVHIKKFEGEFETKYIEEEE